MLPTLYQRYRQLLPTIILAALCLYTVGTAINGKVVLDGTAYDFALTFAHYGALIAVAATLLTFFAVRKLYKYVFGLTLALGFLHIIKFGPMQFSAGLTFGELHLGLDLLCSLVAGVAYLLAYPQINPVLLAPFKYDQQKITRVYHEEIQGFKERFARKSSEELQRLVTDSRLVPAAITAAQQLLQERQTSS